MPRPPSLVLVLALAAFTAGCTFPGPDEGPGEYVPIASFVDIHGIAASPDDANVVYVATHQGLMRGVNGSWARVGSMQDDLMGFSMHPTDANTFWTSGHPKTGGNMGVRQSTDGGFTWTTIWRESVDFHAMTVSPADPTRLWGYWRGELHRSEDGGKTWGSLGQAPAMGALAGHPKDAARLYATTATGIRTSPDAGRTWTPLSEIRAYGLAIDPDDPRTMVAGGQGTLWKSSDGGTNWTPLPTPARASFAFLTVAPTDTSVVYAASYEAGVYRSNDAGRTWTTLMEPSR